ncbi:ribose ABC transporter periplasmic-binding protein [Candidatus Vecturithrix granuli]|uniref:Ribose ABC transporter periplasmic-binding protein n=1 Tax=Vecturithrix granuli TaxID=1499967 RepID=A0A081C3Q0_VECG1|nr:ribose ABC transporter periplasmic-binding protein [Candidatus Vecturithrix granuli]
MKRFVTVATMVLMLAGIGSAWAEDPVTVAFISNGPYQFWTYAAAGIAQLEQDINIKVEFFKPPQAMLEEQKRFIETMLAKGIDGVAISVIDPDNLTPFLDEVAAQVPLVCFDSDAPASKRLAYIGMSNYAAGRMAGEAIRELLPDGGTFIIIVGRLDAQNAIERRQGIIDELRGLPYQSSYPGEMTPADPNIECGKWTLVDTRTDGGDESRAKSNAEDVLIKYPDLDLLLGMWSYSTPAIISAVRDADKLGKIHIVAFDQETEVLQAIRDGYVYATMAQDPYTYGYKSCEILYKLVKGEDPGIPENTLVDVPAVKVTQANVDEFQKKLESQLKAGEFFEQR